MKNYRNMSCIEVAVRDEPEGGEMTVDKSGKDREQATYRSGQTQAR